MIWRLAVATLLAIVACSTAPAEPSAAEIRQRSADRLAQLRSFRFRLDVINGVMAIAPGLTANTVDGAVLAPDRLSLRLDARFGSVPVELQVIGIAGRQFITNPLNGQWQDAAGVLALPTLLDPERGLAGLIRGADGLEKRGRVSQDGVDSYHLAGTISSAALARLIGAETPAHEAVPTELWIGAGDYLPRRARLVGPIVAGESAGLERVMILRDFDAAITIEPPV